MLIQKVDKNKIEILIDSINNLCIKCEYIGQICDICSIGESKTLLKELNLPAEVINALKTYSVLNEIENFNDEPEFNKNDVLLTQNAIESLCDGCEYIGSYCLDCKIHEIRRQIASLPLKEVEMFKEVKQKKSSGGGCGTSCSTGCSTKKKK